MNLHVRRRVRNAATKASGVHLVKTGAALVHVENAAGSDDAVPAKHGFHPRYVFGENRRGDRSFSLALDDAHRDSAHILAASDEFGDPAAAWNPMLEQRPPLVRAVPLEGVISDMLIHVDAERPAVVGELDDCLGDQFFFLIREHARAAGRVI